jgi:cation diffusion facilitator CzcD-associated flavoprotein CzcO
MTNKHEVVIVGGGFSGLLCGYFLKEAGIEDFCILEMGASLGGVWQNGGVGGYPGAACDVPSYAYLPFLDRIGFIPSKKYVSQQEIAEYTDRLVEYCGLAPHIRFSTKVLDVQYGDDGQWQIQTQDMSSGGAGESYVAKHVVSANGPLSTPRMPEVAGMAQFQGPSFHTAQWDYSVDLKGQRVGIIGTGASAAQVITSIADDVESLTVFQRSATWALPRDDEPTPPEIIEAFKKGGYSESLRFVDWQNGTRRDSELPFDFDSLHDHEANAKLCSVIASRIARDVEDPQLAELLTPNYPFFCKRVLFIDDYYTTFNKPNVTLVNDPEGVVSVTATGVKMASGDEHDVDVLIYATGFDSNHIPFPVTGRNGVTLADRYGADADNNWQMTRPQSLWGIHVADLPNFYLMIGPQSLNPVTNVTLLCEEQGKYIANLVSRMAREGKNTVEPTPEAVQGWTERCNATADGKVWLRCNNWYMKSTKSDVAAGRERSQGMWMDTYESYLQHLLGAAGGEPDSLLRFGE